MHHFKFEIAVGLSAGKNVTALLVLFFVESLKEKTYFFFAAEVNWVLLDLSEMQLRTRCCNLLVMDEKVHQRTEKRLLWNPFINFQRLN